MDKGTSLKAEGQEDAGQLQVHEETKKNASTPVLQDKEQVHYIACVRIKSHSWELEELRGWDVSKVFAALRWPDPEDVERLLP